MRVGEDFVQPLAERVLTEEDGQAIDAAFAGESPGSGLANYINVQVMRPAARF